MITPHPGDTFLNDALNHSGEVDLDISHGVADAGDYDPDLEKAIIRVDTTE